MSARAELRHLCPTLMAAFALFGCGTKGFSGSVPTTATDLSPSQDPPGVVATITAVDGGSGPGGFFRPGDHVSVAFTLKKHDGSAWNLFEMSTARALVSGPTFNYQRVITEQADVGARSEQHALGAFEYTFDVPIPSAYPAPLNDTTAFGGGDGELQGHALFDGTYTVGLSFAWTYTIAGQTYHDVGEATADFLFGGSATLVHREVVKQANCERCHVALQAHGGLRRNLTLCLCCHTVGAEDANNPSIEGGTAGVTVQSRVLFHKIHNGSHLPSVVGVSTNLDGTLDYDALPKAYKTVDSAGGVHDYSDVGFPAWPNRTIPTPKEFAYGLLPPEAQAKQDKIHTGVTACYICHGDPDGLGPMTAPAQGNIVYSEASRAACGACHDDIDWTRRYIANFPNDIDGGGMPPQLDDSACKDCHTPSGATTLTVTGAHLHPLLDRTVNPGLQIGITNLAESGVNDGDGTIDPGEKISVTFTLKNDKGVEVSPSQIVSLRAILSGPTSNSNLVLETDIPKAALGNSQPFTIDVPERLLFELVGHSTAALGETFFTSRAPHLDVAGALTQVFARTTTAGGASALSTSASELQNFVDVVDATGFARDDNIVIDDGVPGEEEYLRIQFIDGQRLWFSSPETPAYAPGLRAAHALGATVLEVVLVPKFKNVNFALDAVTGAITELTEFGGGNAVLVSYSSGFVMPSKVPLAANASPDLDETLGKWTGKSLAAGTYRLALSGYRTFNYPQFFEPNTFKASSPPAVRDFLVGSASAIEPYALISSADNCYACHQDIWYHDATYRGFDTCIACHAAAGSEDRPRYVAANAPDTPGVTVNFRTMLHKVHMGKNLPDANTFTVVGSGPDPHPDNFTANTFQQIRFPAQPGGTAQCAKCHGSANPSWITPAPRDHPTEQGYPVQVWRAACVSCHDSATTSAHADSFTSAGGVEMCADCHAPGGVKSVEDVHKVH